MTASAVWALERQPRIVGGVESEAGHWSFMAALMHRLRSLQVGEREFVADLMRNAPAVEASGAVADCGRAVVTCTDVSGKICLIERDGILEFETKAKNCQAGGGVGAVIYNNDDDLFGGVVSENSLDIPVLSISREDGLELLNQLGASVSYGFSDQAPTNSFCGGSYIGDGWVVTAAHCTESLEPEAILVNIGGHDLTTDHENVIPVKQIINHPDYDDVTIQNDVALLELAYEPTGVSSVELGDAAQLEIATASDLPVTILGRGGQEALKEDDDPGLAVPVPALFEAELKLATNEQCAQAFIDYATSSNPLGIAPNPDELLYPETFCAGRPEGGIGACFGDSGGPLLLEDNGRYVLLGLTSWGIGCAQPDLYDVYTRLPLYKDVIEAVRTHERTGFSLPPEPTPPSSDGGGTETPKTPADPANVSKNNAGLFGIGAISFWSLFLGFGLAAVTRRRRVGL